MLGKKIIKKNNRERQALWSQNYATENLQQCSTLISRVDNAMPCHAIILGTTDMMYTAVYERAKSKERTKKSVEKKGKEKKKLPCLPCRGCSRHS